MPRRARLVVSIAMAKSRLPALVRRAEAGEEIVIARNHRPIAVLAPMASPAMRKAGTARGQVILAADFDATPKDFGDDLVEAGSRRRLRRPPSP